MFERFSSEDKFFKKTGYEMYQYEHSLRVLKMYEHEQYLAI